MAAGRLGLARQHSIPLLGGRQVQGQRVSTLVLPLSCSRQAGQARQASALGAIGQAATQPSSLRCQSLRAPCCLQRAAAAEQLSSTQASLHAMKA